MIDAFLELWNSGEVWSIVFKALISLILSGIATLLATSIVKIITKSKESRIYKYTDTLIEAAEQKFPNEGTKMGPQKMEYVMGQLAIRFPGIKDVRYLYNIAEQAVFKFNDKRQQQKQIQEFEAKFGKGSYILGDDVSSDVDIVDSDDVEVVDDIIELVDSEQSTQVDEVIQNKSFGDFMKSVFKKFNKNKISV